MKTKERREIKKLEPLKVPFEVLVDHREQLPYTFKDFYAGSKQKHRPLVIDTKTVQLKTGDYSIVGFHDQVTIERKSLRDLYTTLSTTDGRDRFEREHQRMTKFEFAAVVIEASWDTVLQRPPITSKLLPKSIFGTANAWLIRYGIPWIMADNRAYAERKTFRLLERWWLEKMNLTKPKKKRQKVTN